MQNFHVSAKRDQQPAAGKAFRISPAIHLNTGDLVGAFVDLPMAFDDRPSFDLVEKQPNAAEWIADKLGQLCRVAVAEDIRERPLVLPMPAAALSQADVVGRCLDAMNGARLCPQEVCFEINDAAIASSPLDISTVFRNFRQRGFRVAVDARRSCTADIRGSTWLMVDTLRIQFEDGNIPDEVVGIVDHAQAAGVAIVVEGAYWRDGDYLASLGIEYGLHPRADA